MQQQRTAPFGRCRGRGLFWGLECGLCLMFGKTSLALVMLLYYDD